MATSGGAGERLERARDAAALIGADAPARDAFERAYTGRGRAVGALEALLRGDAADPDLVASLDRHRRSAFGRPDGPAEEAAATAALVALRREEEGAQADSEALDRAIGVVLAREAQLLAAGHAADASPAPPGDGDADGASAPRDPGPAASPTRSRVRPVLAVAAIVAAITLGAAGQAFVTSALAGQEPEGASPTPITYFRDPVALEPETKIGGPGDIAIAERWFEGEQAPLDVYPNADLLDGIDPASTRLVQSSADDSRVWVGRGTTAEYCVLIYAAAEGLGATSCARPEDFAASGLALSSGYVSVEWHGADLTVSTLPR